MASHFPIRTIRQNRVQDLVSNSPLSTFSILYSTFYQTQVFTSNKIHCTIPWYAQIYFNRTNSFSWLWKCFPIFVAKVWGVKSHTGPMFSVNWFCGNANGIVRLFCGKTEEKKRIRRRNVSFSTKFGNIKKEKSWR